MATRTGWQIIRQQDTVLRKRTTHRLWQGWKVTKAWSSHILLPQTLREKARCPHLKVQMIKSFFTIGKSICAIDSVPVDNQEKKLPQPKWRRSITSLHSQVAAVEVLLSNWMPCLYREPFAFLYFLYQIHLMKALTVVTHYCWQWYWNHGSPVGNMLRDGIAHSQWCHCIAQGH